MVQAPDVDGLARVASTKSSLILQTSELNFGKVYLQVVALLYVDGYPIFYE